MFAGLEPEVELLDDRLGEELDERRWVGERRDRDPPDEMRGDPRHDAQVLAHEVVTCGRWTLTTTCSPVRKRAAWTWAIDAAASGVRSNHSNVAPIGPPSSSSTTFSTTAHGSGFTWSRQSLNSSTSSAGKRPSPEEMICPSLM